MRNPKVRLMRLSSNAMPADPPGTTSGDHTQMPERTRRGPRRQRRRRFKILETSRAVAWADRRPSDST